MKNCNENESLLLANPELAMEWSERNVPPTPVNIRTSDYVERWWKCKKCNHEWTARTYQRHKGLGKCIKCRSLGILCPSLVKEWSLKNGQNSIYEYTCKSHYSAWWKCQVCSHEYKSKIKNRYYGHGCPLCARKKLSEQKQMPMSGKSFGEVFPAIAKQWDDKKNGSLTPNDVCPKSSKKVWWRCETCNYQWITSPNLRSRSSKHSAHAVCPNMPLAVQYANSLCFLEPEIACEFVKCENAHVRPETISIGSRYLVSWKCSKCDTSWDAKIGDRVAGYNNCPKCNKTILLKDGTKCSSLVEAYFYLKYTLEGEKFSFNKKYSLNKGVMGNCRYDFCFPEKNLFVEVTSFQKGFRRWYSYLRCIIRKRKYVEGVLKGNFLFIQHNLTPLQRKYVRENIK